MKVAMSKSLGGDAFTRNLMDDAQTDRQRDRRTTDRLWYEVNIPFFSKEKSGYKKDLSETGMAHRKRAWRSKKMAMA